MDKTKLNKILAEVLTKNVDPAQAEIMKNIMNNFLKDVSQKDLDTLEDELKKTLKVKTVFD